jgi:Arc/MetJ-type ribon-helix-helix transcriptional regulator
MPFEQMTEWIQLEVHRGDYDRADDLIRGYIYNSTRLSENPSAQKQD